MKRGWIGEKRLPDDKEGFGGTQKLSLIRVDKDATDVVVKFRLRRFLSSGDKGSQSALRAFWVERARVFSVDRASC